MLHILFLCSKWKPTKCYTINEENSPGANRKRVRNSLTTIDKNELKTENNKDIRYTYIGEKGRE